MIPAQGEMLLLNDGHGFADRNRRSANTAETLFNIGKITSQFAAPALILYHRLHNHLDERSAPPGHLPGPLLGHLS